MPAQPTAADAVTLVISPSLTPLYAVRPAPDTVLISGTTIDVTYSGVAALGQPSAGPLPLPLGQLAPGLYTINVYVQPVAEFGGPATSASKLELSLQLGVGYAPANYAPQVGPSPIASGTLLTFWAELPQESCFNQYQIDRVTTIGNAITVEYSVFPGTPPGFACFTIMPPLVINLPLGSLLPGDYTVQATGIFHGRSGDVQNEPVGLAFTVLPAPVTAVEYYWAAGDHYFVTADPQEIAALDAGRFPGWARTGPTFKVLPVATPLSLTPSRVCRFYGRPEAGLDSHFYSASPAECQAVIDRFSNAWVYESGDVFVAYLPDEATGNCPVNTTPLYRVYDNRSDVNHRYATSIDIRSQMINAGWLPEGYGFNAVAMCVL